MGTVLPFPRAIARTVEAFMMVRYLLASMYSFWRSISSTISELLSTGSYKRAM